MANASANRLYYAVQALQMQGVNGPGVDTDPEATGEWRSVFGVQSVGINTNFNLENIFELGTFSQYAVLDDNPEIELTVNKVIDYTTPLYVFACGGSGYSTTGKNILDVGSRRVNARLLVASDVGWQNVSGTVPLQVKMTGMYVNSVTYNLTTDGRFTEEATFVGNNKVWYSNSDAAAENAGNSFVHPDSGNREGSATSTVKGFDDVLATGVARRFNLNLADSVLPSGTTSWDGGIVMPYDGTKHVMPHIQNLTVSVNLGREPILELGSRNPYTRTIAVPLEVTSEFQVLATGFDVSATNFASADACSANTKNGQAREIYLRICGPTTSDTTAGINMYLGKNNRLTSVNYSGGDTGGGNVTVTYSFTGYNTFYVDQGAKLTITSAPYNGIGYNTCGRTASGIEGSTVTFSTGGGADGVDTGSTA